MFLSKETFLILTQRGWQSVGGLVTLVIISTFLTPDQQGWYYAFVSIAALYSVFEMGLASAVLQVGAHMFSGLSWGSGGQLEGNGVVKFESFAKASVKVYLKLALLFVVVVMPIGAYIFGTKDTAYLSESWGLPWVVIVIGTASNMLFLPFQALFEGSGAIKEVYSVRLLQGIMGTIACWIALLCGGYLWAAAMMPIAGAFVAAIWLVKRKPVFLSETLKIQDNHFDWRSQVWTLQWRVGVSWISVFFMSQLATPIVFYFQDAVIAGQMGLTLTIAHMIGILSQSWIARDVPAMSMAVGRNDWKFLDRTFLADFKHMIFVFAIGCAVLLFVYGILASTPYIDRVLPFWQVMGLLIFVLLFQVSAAFSSYLRCFRREPLMFVYVAGAAMILVGSLWAAANHSASGIVCVMLAVQGFFVFPMAVFVWKKSRQSWLDGALVR